MSVIDRCLFKLKLLLHKRADRQVLLLLQLRATAALTAEAE
jgi:hypothetical protein